MPSVNDRKPRSAGVFSARGLFVIGALVVLVAGGAGGYWQWRYALPPKIDTIGPIHQLTAETTGGLAFDSPDNAVNGYRALFMDLLGLSGAMHDTRTPDAGNALYAEWWSMRKDLAVDALLKGEWGDPRHAEPMARLARLRPILDALDDAVDAEGFRARYSASGDIYNPSDGREIVEGVDILLPHLSPFRALGELNAAQMRVSAQGGDWADLARRAGAGLRHANHCAAEPFIISAMVGVSLHAQLFQELRFIANELALPPEVCDALIAEIEAAGEPPSLLTSLESDRLCLPSSIRWYYIEESGGGPLWADFWIARFGGPSPRVAMRDGERYYEEMKRYAAMPYAERSSAVPPDPGEAKWFIGSFWRVIDQHDTVRAQRAATIAILRLERFHALNGSWPANLEEAMTREQTLEPVTGAPFIYLLGADGMRPEIKGDKAEAYLPSDLALARTKNMAFEKEEELAGPGWPFTLLAPTEAMFVKDPEFTTRRGVIWEPPVRDASLR